ncbi:MAG: hypothetical protein Phyf2KO_05300 [Phycisphaerales bacterium]
MGKKPSQQSSQSNRATMIRAARDALRQNQFAQSVRILEPLLAASSPDAEALYIAGLVAERQLRPDAAIALARRSIAAMSHPDSLRLLASNLRKVGELDEAIRVCDLLLEAKPDSKEALAIKGDALQESGELDAAEAALDRLDAIFRAEGQEPHPSVIETRARLRIQQGRHDEAVALCDSILERASNAPSLVRLAFFTKAKACDRAGRYQEALEAASQANQIGNAAFDPAEFEQSITNVIDQWSKARLDRFPRSECHSKVPVFIAGMPRSGTSLLDQIIDAHPHAAGVGELQTILRFAGEMGREYDPTSDPPDCFGQFSQDSRWTSAAEGYLHQLEKLAPDAERVVNKALGNDFVVGVFARLFPQTRIIHLRRDPRDVAISCFMGAFNTAVFPWTTRIDWTIKAWEQSERLMAHWKDTLDVPILELRYEDLVSEPKTQIPELLDFLGLDPSSECFEFYKRKRPIRTLSHDQVSKPMYTTSVGRSRHYEAQLASFEFPRYEDGA